MITYLPEVMIITEDRLAEELKLLNDQIIVFAPGAFDIFHTGHLFYLEQAKNQGNVLVVWVNSDRAVARLKKFHPLFFSFKDRAKLVAALKAVDYVIEFDEDSPARILKKLKPQVVARSGQPQKDNPMHKLSESLGIRMFYCPEVNGLSSTKIIKHIKFN